MKNRLLAPAEAEPDTAIPDDPADHTGPTHLTTSQAAAFAQLAAMAELAAHSVRYAGIAVRAVPLLVGESGVGKTSVVTRLADHLGSEGKPLPVLHLTAPGWIIQAARSEPATLSVIRSFVRRHPVPESRLAGILFLDETDKAVAGPAAWSDPYSVTLLGELLSVLDRDQRLLSTGWTRQDIERFGHYMIIGAGAWQRTHDQAAMEGSSYLDLVEKDPVIPVEVARRFSRTIELTLPTKADFVRILTRLYDDLGLPNPTESLIAVVAEAAVRSGRGMRWIEAHLVDVLSKYPKLRRKAPRAEGPKEEKPVFSPAAYDVALRDAYDQMAAVEPALAYLQAQVRLHADHFFPEQQEDPPLGKLFSAAGVCEEILFRGFLIRWLHGGALGLPLVGALAASSLIFGLGHAYQGFKGVLSTAVGGLVLGLLFLLSGQLIPAMVLHALLDLQVVYVLWPRDLATR